MDGFKPANLTLLIADILETHAERSWTPQELRWEVNRIRGGNTTVGAVRTAARTNVQRGRAASKLVDIAFNHGGKTNYTKRLSIRWKELQDAG